MNRSHLLCTLLSIASGTAVAFAADDTASVRLTLSDALTRAKAQAPRLAQASSQQDAARYGLAVAKSGRRPVVDVAAGYTRQSDVPELSIPLPGGGSRPIFPNLPDNFRSRVAVAVPLYTGGRTGASIDAATAQRDLAGADLRLADQDVALETVSAYWTLLASRERERVVRTSLAAYDQHLLDAQHREAEGLVAHNEVLGVEVDKDRAELTRLRAESAAAIAEANLQRLTGLPPGTHIELDAALDAAPAVPPDVDSLVREALERRPERVVLRAQERAQRAEVRVENSARYPVVSASAGYDYADPNRRLLPPTESWRGSWDAGISVGFSIYDGGRAGAAAARRRAQADAVTHQLEDLDQRIRLDVTTRVLELRTALAALEVAEHQIASARENTRVERDRYQAGVSRSADLLDAENRQLQAELDRTNALYDIRIAQAHLERAIGR